MSKYLILPHGISSFANEYKKDGPGMRRIKRNHGKLQKHIVSLLLLWSTPLVPRLLELMHRLSLSLPKYIAAAVTWSMWLMAKWEYERLN